MLRKIFPFVLVFFYGISSALAQKDTIDLPGKMKPSFQRLLLDLSTTYFTVVNENQVDLDSSLIHVSQKFGLSRVPVVADGFDDKDILSKAQWIDEGEPWVGQNQLNAATGQKHAALSILLGAYFAFEPGNDDKEISKGFYFLNQGLKECNEGNNATLKLVGQRLLGKLYLKNNDFITADKTFANVKNGYLNAGNRYEAATTCSWWGVYTPVIASGTQPRIQHIEMAYQLFKSIDNKEGQINSLINDCYLHLLVNDPVSAEQLAKKAVALTESIRFPYAHYVTKALMTTTRFRGKFGEPLTYCIKSIENSETTKDSIILPYLYGDIGVLYHNEGNREDIAIDWEKKSVNIFLSQHEHNSVGVHDLVDMLLAHNRKEEALSYIKKSIKEAPPVTLLDSLFYNLTMGLYETSAKQWASAHKFLNKAALVENAVEKHGLNVRKPEVLISIANLDYKEGNYKQAKLYYKQFLSLQSIGNGGLYGDNAVALESLIKIDSLAGDYKAQIDDYRQFTDATIRNYDISKTMLAEELQVKYATTERINQINLLNRNAKLEQANLQQANLTKNITIAGIILLIVIAGLLYRQTEIRKKSNHIITRKNEMMQKLLDEKEWLLKEVHHRVKNNLHTIICLLESQAVYLENDALKAIENSQHRIYAMSLIHQKLYQSDDIKIVDMNTYLTEFVHYLQDSFGSPENIQVILQAENVKLDAAQAIPIGLIINEAVTNSFKYAFPKQKKGEIKIALKQDGNSIQLSVTDNGVGFNQQVDHSSNSLGLELIKGLTVDLHGILNFEANKGTSVSINFMIDPVAAQLNEEDDAYLNSLVG